MNEFKETYLTKEEIKWVEENHNIAFTGDPNWLPYEAFEKDGSYVGIVSEHLKLIEKLTGLKFIPVQVNSWTESLEIATSGQVSVISGDAADIVLNKKFRPIDTYSKNKIVIVMRVDQNHIEDLNEIKNKKIAIIKGYGYTSDILKSYPDINFIEVENIQDGLEGVASGHFDAMLATFSLATYTISEIGLNNIKVVGHTNVVMDLTLFVDKEKPLLHSVINKALKSISLSESNNISKRWIKEHYVETKDYTLALKIATAFFVSLIFFLYRHYYLSNKVRQITEAEVELNKFKNILDKTLDCIFIFDAEHLKFTYVNDGAVNQIGYSFDEIENMHPYDIKPNISKDEFMDIVSPLLSSEEKFINFETVHQHKNGDRINVEIFLQYIAEQSNFIAIVRDITERKLLESELESYRDTLEGQVEKRTLELITAKDQAELASRSKSEFLSRMSHELRTPLNAILGFGQMLEMKDGGFTETQRGNVQEILSAANHLLVLINDVLDLSRIDAGYLEVVNEKLYIDGILKESLTLIESNANLRNISIVDNLTGNNFYINADGIRFKQVLVNLLSNAVKYNSECGKIIINTILTGGNRLRINIVDEGKGLSKKDIDKLFNRFERLENNNVVDGVGVGVGIGLVITKYLVELMNGHVGVESIVGQGSTFWIEFFIEKE